MISIVFATYNERDSIEAAIDAVLKAAPDEIEIIVVDDDSPDRTWQVVGSLNLPNVKAIRRRRMRGLASAFNRGIIEARGDYIGWLDADLGMPPSLIPEMYRLLTEEGYDMVCGSRYVAGGGDDRHWARVLASRMINGLARLVLGYGIRDYDSGFILMRRSVLDSVTLIPTGHGEYCFEFIYDACRKGLRVREVGYCFRERTAGESKSAPSVLRFLYTGAKYAARIFVARLRAIG